MTAVSFFIFVWSLPSIIIGFIGINRKIGFWGALFLSLIFSPIIGLIVTLVSKSKEDIENQQELLKVQTEQNDTLKKMAKKQTVSNIADEIKKIKELLDSGAISKEEFDKLKNMIFENQTTTEDNSENDQKVLHEDKCPKCGTANKDNLSFCISCFGKIPIIKNKVSTEPEVFVYEKKTGESKYITKKKWDENLKNGETNDYELI